MRTFFLPLVLLIGVGAFLLFGPGADEPAPLVKKMRAAVGEAGTVSIEEAADYWLTETASSAPGTMPRRAALHWPSPSGSAAWKPLEWE